MGSSTRRLGRYPARKSEAMELSTIQEHYLLHHGALGHSPKTVSHYRDTFKSFDLFLAERRPSDPLGPLESARLRDGFERGIVRR
jgi:hypothetical protein